MIPYVITPKDKQISLPVPDKYIGKRIEVSVSFKVLPLIKGKKIKLSERFLGCLSEQRGEELQKEVTKMRNEWDRDIY